VTAPPEGDWADLQELQLYHSVRLRPFEKTFVSCLPFFTTRYSPAFEMACIGEVSAIVGLAAIAVKLSSAVIEISARYKDARKEIESFGVEIGILGHFIDQFQRLCLKESSRFDSKAYSVTNSIAGQCSTLLNELVVYKENLYGRLGSARTPTFREKSKWVFRSTELKNLKARVESNKANMQFMMTIQCMQSASERYCDYLHGLKPKADHVMTRLESNTASEEDSLQLRSLELYSDTCVKELEALKEQSLLSNSSECDTAIGQVSIRSVDAAFDARSIRDSILSLCGHQSYSENIVDRLGGDSTFTVERQLDEARVSRFIEEHIDPRSLSESEDHSHILWNPCASARTDQTTMDGERYSTVHHGRDHYHKAPLVSPETMHDVQEHTVTHSPGRTCHGGWETKASQLYLQESATDRPEPSGEVQESTNTMDLQLRQRDESFIPPGPRDESKEHGGENVVELRKRGYMGGVPFAELLEVGDGLLRPKSPSLTHPAFRVTMEDPCWKFLPVAIGPSNIGGDWKLHDLYVVCDDLYDGFKEYYEHCLALEEMPLVIFNELLWDGRKPRFVLRRRFGAPHVPPHERTSLDEWSEEDSDWSL
jgi:hypothetical protein